MRAVIYLRRRIEGIPNLGIQERQQHPEDETLRLQEGPVQQPDQKDNENRDSINLIPRLRCDAEEEIQEDKKPKPNPILLNALAKWFPKKDQERTTGP